MRTHGSRLLLVLALIGAVGLMAAGPAQAGKKRIKSTVGLDALDIEVGEGTVFLDGTVSSNAAGCLAKRKLSVIDGDLTEVATGQSTNAGEFSIDQSNAGLAVGDYSVVMAKKKLSRRKICLGDSAILNMTQADASSTNTFDDQTNTFSGTFTSTAPACQNNREVVLYVSHDGGNNDFTEIDSSTTGDSGAWEFTLPDTPEDGNWDVYGPEQIITPGDPDVATGNLNVTVCNSFDSPDVVIGTS